MPRKRTRMTRQRRPNVFRALVGSTRSQPFESLLSRFNLSTALVGLNNNFITVAQLMNGDLVTRQVRLLSLVVRFHPYNQATTSGSHYEVQLQYIDPIVPATTIVPVSATTPLSSTDVVRLNGVLPLQSGWQPANAAANIINIPVWAQALLAAGLYCDIVTHWLVAQDNLT